MRQDFFKKPLCHPFTSSICFIESVVTNRWQFVTLSWAELSVEVSAEDFHALVLFNRRSNRFVCFSTWWSGYPLCGMYALTKIIGCLLTEIDAATTRSHAHWIQLICFFHLLLSMIATPCLLVNIPDSTTMWPWWVSDTSLPWRHVSEINITSHLNRCTSLNSSSSLSLEFIDLVFFCKTMNVVFSCLSSFSFRGEFLLLLPSTSAFEVSVASSCTASASSFSRFLLFSSQAAALWVSLLFVSSSLPVKKTFLLSLLLNDKWILIVFCSFLLYFRHDYS